MGLFSKKQEKRGEEIEFSSDGSGSEMLTAALGGESVLTVSTALQVPAVARCVNMIAEAAAALPIKLYRTSGGEVEEVENDPRTAILNNATGDTLNADSMRRKWVRDYLLTGSAYAYIERDCGIPAKIYYIPSHEVHTAKTGESIIHKHYMYTVRGQQIYPYEMLKILRNSDGFGRGTGIVKESPLIIETMYQLIKFQKNQVRKGGNKKGFLQTKGPVRNDVVKDIKSNWKNLNSNENVENVMFLNGDIDFKEMSSTSVEMQLNENFKTNNSEIMRLFGTNDGVLSEETVKNAVMPVLDAFEAAFDSDLLLEREKGEYYFAFDTRELTRGDILTRFNAYGVALQYGFMQVDEVRVREDLPRIGFDYIKLGLQDVLLNPKTGEIYTPNTNATANMSNLAESTLTKSEANDNIDIGESRGNPNHDDRGRFTFGSSKMSRAEIKKVSSGILTDHPDYKKGKNYVYEYGNYSYFFKVNDYGDYQFKGKLAICEKNREKIDMQRRMSKDDE